MNHTSRTADLKRMLTGKRLEVHAEIRSRVRETRRDWPIDVREDLECVEAGAQGDIAPARVQVGLQAVARIDDALARLDAGKYGSCLECAREISEGRLRALPFAVRCQACEERRERECGRQQASEQKSLDMSPSPDVPRA